MRKMLVILTILAAGCAVPMPRPTMFMKASMTPSAINATDPAAREKAAVKAALLRYYPRLARNGERGTQTVFFVTTTTGRVERTDLMRGLPPAGPTEEALLQRFTDLRNDGSRLASGVTRFEPGELGADTVVVIWTERQAAGPTGPYRFAGSASPRSRATAGKE